VFSIVLVEDEELIRKELVLTIPWESIDCRIIGEAEDGLEGERLIHDLNPDIVLTDIRLPGQSGLDMLASCTHQASIIFTGYNDFTLAQQAIRLGVYDYLLKPVDEDELLTVVSNLCRTLRITTNKETTDNGSLPSEKIIQGDPYVRLAMDYIDTHYPEDISLYSLAREFGISESHLSHLFKQYSGYTFLRYLQDCRVRHAIIMLQDPRYQITEIYQRCGFSNGSYFSRIFKRFTGVTPSDYRRGYILK